MAQLIEHETARTVPRGERDKAVKILAKSLFRELRMQGYDTRQIVALSTELIGLVTSEIRPDGKLTDR